MRLKFGILDMALNTDATVPSAASGAVEEEPQQQQPEQETNQQAPTESDHTPNSSQPVKSEQQDPAPVPTPSPALDPTPSQDAPPKDHLTVIDEKMETSKYILKFTFRLKFAPRASSTEFEHPLPKLHLLNIFMLSVTNKMLYSQTFAVNFCLGLLLFHLKSLKLSYSFVVLSPR